MTLSHSKPSKSIQIEAQRLGFELVGVLKIEASQTIETYHRWLAKGYAGEMQYLQRHAEKKQDPRTLLPEAQSLITLAINYRTLDPDPKQRQDPSRGQISRYAWGDDYHDVIKEKLKQLEVFIQNQLASETPSRIYVDTGPLLEREYAHRAGLGWFGKHSNLIHWRSGSWFFLAELLVSAPLEEIHLPLKGDCGRCTLCIDACPTQAIVADREVDSRRCISYLTIELKDSIPEELRPQMGNWIYGCDICQDVCPWNRRAPISTEPAFQPRPHNLLPELMSLLYLTPEDFRQRFKGSPIKRTKRRGLLRNVAIALGNWGHPDAIPALQHGLQDEEPLIREHVAWALGQIQHARAAEVLQQALETEKDLKVLEAIRKGLVI